MNANELADELEKGHTASQALRNEVATMLRMLDGQLAFRIDAVTKYQKKVEEQQAEIEVLKETLQGRDRYIDLLMEAQEK